MSNILQTLIPLLSFLAIALALAASPARGQGAAVPDATSFTYDFWGDRPTTLSYQGDAHFASDTTFLVMTKLDASGNAVPLSAGRAVYTAPVLFWEAGGQVDFETTVKFIIKPNPTGNVDRGDGFTFFIAPVGHPVGFTGASFGIFDKDGKDASVFAVEFDIYSNPGVDPSYSHVGIDVGSNVSKNTTDVGDAFLGQEVTAIIDYEQDTKLIFVRVSAGGKSFEVKYEFDLSTILPQQVQVGISAATGGAIAVHELIAWYFTSTIVHKGAISDANAAAGIRQYV